MPLKNWGGVAVLYSELNNHIHNHVQWEFTHNQSSAHWEPLTQLIVKHIKIVLFLMNGDVFTYCD